MKRALIFGANGFVGPYLTTELSNNGYEVICCGHNENPHDNFHAIDITNFNDVYDVLSKEEPDVVFNLAAISSVSYSWRNPQKTVNVNIIGTINILESCAKVCPKTKILLIGSCEEYKTSNNPVSENSPVFPINPYGITRTATEDFARIYRIEYGLNIICIRAFNHTGVGQTTNFVLPSFVKQTADISKSKSSGEILVGNLNVFRDFSDVRDVVTAYRMIADSKEDIDVINVGSGTAYNLKDLLNYIITLSDQSITIKIDESKIRPTDIQYSCCDNTYLREKVNWSPKYNIYDTLKNMYNHYLQG